MRKKILIGFFSRFFILLYFVAFLQGSEVFRVPQLLNHYSVHKSQNPDMDFTGFMVLHYLSSDVHDDDYQEDQKLPFKQTQSALFTSHIVLSVPPQAEWQRKVPEGAEEQTQHSFGYAAFPVSDRSFSVFRPPIV